MPRAARYLQEGYVYHLTHRCLDGEFFLRFTRERDAYREWLRVGATRYKVPVLGYTITSNHVHVVVDAQDRYAVADMMKLASASVAQSRNLLKRREGSAWEHPYHCTRVQDGRHLLNCLRYVDLNMVRAGKVKHPRDWRWCSYDELTGRRRRYGIINQERLLHLTGFCNMAALADFHDAHIEEQLSGAFRGREACWTECVAIGDRAFVDEAEKTVAYRRSMHRTELERSDGQSTWAVREPSAGYMAGSASKTEV